MAWLDIEEDGREVRRELHGARLYVGKQSRSSQSVIIEILFGSKNRAPHTHDPMYEIIRKKLDDRVVISSDV